MTKTGRSLTQSSFVLAALAISLMTCLGFQRNAFTPDSWTNFEISKTIFSDFYHINTRIQYQIDTEYSTAFPPLTPILMRIVDVAFGKGIQSGVIINAAFSAALLALLMRFFLVMRQQVWPGLMVYLTIQSSKTFIDEVQSGRSVTKSVFLWCLLIYLYLTPSRKPNLRVLFLGVVTGLMAVNRYDTFVATLIFSLGIYAREKKWTHVGIFLATHFAILSPWLFYSLSNFGRPMPSEASKMLLLAFDNYAVDYFPSAVGLPTLFSHPAAWLGATFRRISVGAVGLFQMRYLLPLVLFGTFLASRGAAHRPSLSPSEKRGLLFLAILPAVHLPSVVLSGLPTARYFVPELLFAAIALALAISRPLSSNSVKELGRYRLNFQAQMATLLIGVLAVLQVWHFSNFGTCGIQVDCYYNLTDLSPAEVSLRQTLLDARREKSRILILGAGVYPYRFGAITGLQTFVPPSNANECILTKLIENYRIDVVVVDASAYGQGILRQFKFTELGKNVVALQGRRENIEFLEPCDSQYRHLAIRGA